MSHSIQPSSQNFVPSVIGQHAAPPQASEEVDLNEVLWNLMKKMEAEQGRLSVIQKFDKLPVVKGNREELHSLFGALLSMVFSLPPDNTKSLLYIQCAEEKADEDVMDLSLKNEKYYSIYFHTNIRTCESWMQHNKAKLDEAYLNASRASGSLAHFNITKTGCLFSLKIPGKIL
jgi:hypothetical protein